MGVTYPRYGHDGCSFKLIMQKFIYNIHPNINSSGFEVDFDVIRSTIQVVKEKLDLI